MERERLTFPDKLNKARSELCSNTVGGYTMNCPIVPLWMEIKLKQADSLIADKLIRWQINKLLKEKLITVS